MKFERRDLANLSLKIAVKIGTIYKWLKFSKLQKQQNFACFVKYFYQIVPMLLSITKRGIFERVTVILLFKFLIRSTSWSYRSSGVTGDKMLLNDEFLVMNYARQQKLITHNSNLIVLKAPFSLVYRGWKYCLNS